MTKEIDIQEAFDRFRINWGSTMVTYYEEGLVYRVARGYGKKASIVAATVLRDLGLDGRLEAVATDLLANDSFSIIEKKQPTNAE